MKHFDKNLTEEMRNVRVSHIEKRWRQLHELSKEPDESAIKYLFITNAGGAVAVLTYLGSIANTDTETSQITSALFLFFSGLILVGIYKAYFVHHHEFLFKEYRTLVVKYYAQQIDWDTMLNDDEENVGDSKFPYVLGYSAFACFITGSIIGVCGIL